MTYLPPGYVPDFETDPEGFAVHQAMQLSAPPDDHAAPVKSGRRDSAQSSEENTKRLLVTCACDVELEAVSWLWFGWLASGKFHILAGAAGTGKTTIAVNAAATLTTGGRWPDGTESPTADVLIWSGEDDPADTLAPRLVAAGADLARVHFISGVTTRDHHRPFDPALDMTHLREYLEDHPEVKLLIVDPVVSAVTGDSHKNTEVRRALQPLADLGAACGCAVIGITHFSKGTGVKDPLERVTGSIAFGALARIVLATCKLEGDDIEEGTRLFARTKSNIGPDNGGFHYRFEQTELTDHPGVIASRVVWGDAVEGSARELMAVADTDGEESGALIEAKDFLTEELSAGPLHSKKLITDARQSGIAERTLKRAKSALNIKSEKGVSGWLWSLPDQGGQQGCHSKTLAPLASLASLNPSQTRTGTEGGQGCQQCQPNQVEDDGTLDDLPSFDF